MNPDRNTETSKKPKRVGRVQRTWQALFALTLIAAGLAGWNYFSTQRDIAAALGPPNEGQKSFFISAADRPDINEFYKALKPAQRRIMATHIGEHSAPQLAKLIGILLGDFDKPSRDILEKSLTRIAKDYPDAVTEQLKLPSAFQRLGVFGALRSLGPDAYPAVAKRLRDNDQRANANQFLVEAGDQAVPTLLPYLEDENKDARLSAADALGKIRDRRATPKLIDKYQRAPEDEKLGFLSALASIGDPVAEPVLRTAYQNRELPTQLRVQAVLGLGRIATPSSIGLLWKDLNAISEELGAAGEDGLVLGGNASLNYPNVALEQKIRIAKSIRTDRADQLIVQALQTPSTASAAAEAAANRPTLTRMLVARLLRSDPSDEGKLIDKMMMALGTTEPGRAELVKLAKNPSLGGFAQRRMRLSRT